MQVMRVMKAPSLLKAAGTPRGKPALRQVSTATLVQAMPEQAD